MKSKSLKVTLGALAAILAVLAVIAGVSYYSPWLAMDKIKSALSSKDEARLNVLIDWASVRENLTRKVALDALRSAGLKPGDEHVNEVILGVEQVVDRLLTVENVALMLDSSNEKPKNLKIRGTYLNVGVFLFAIQNPENKSALSVRLRRLGPMSWRVDEVLFIDPRLLEGK